ncbi:MAG: serine hydrolase [Ignavibacteriales bacterium]|nr:serine hydrolase [Ignavibacteriales bacterium]
MRFGNGRIRGFAVFVLLSTVWFGLFAQSEPFEGLNSYILKAMKEWETPGLAIAIVKNDSIIFAKGYGVRKLGENAPVTPNTIFAIASTTKAMTVACLAMLVDEGRLKWDDPVTKYIPWFQLYDPYVTRELTVRDLLCHRSGLERGDGLWSISSFGREEILRRVRLLKPAWSFRSRYGYQNTMFIAAGEIVPAVTGKSWDEFIIERLFKPLGMSRSSTSVSALQGKDDVASPHYRIDDVMQPVNWVDYDNIGGAGAVNSSVMDMAQWVRLNLANGVFANKRLLSTNVVREIQSSQTVIRIDSIDATLKPSMHFRSYGLGWFLQDYLGRKIVFHTGSLNYMRTRILFIPEEQFGFVVIQNSPNENLHESIGYWILDRLLGGADRDWSAELRTTANEAEAKSKAAQRKRIEARVTGTKPSLALDKYAGTYENELYGKVSVQLQDGKLAMQLSASYEGVMEHWHYDTFEITWKDRTSGEDTIVFTIGADGNVDSLTWEGFAAFKKLK